MKTKVAILAAAALAFATLPSCTSTGGIDPSAAVFAAELGNGYLRYREIQAEQDTIEYQRFLDAQAAKQQAEAAAAAAAQAQWQMQTQMQPASPYVYRDPVTTF